MYECLYVQLQLCIGKFVWPICINYFTSQQLLLSQPSRVMAFSFVFFRNRFQRVRTALFLNIWKIIKIYILLKDLNGHVINTKWCETQLQAHLYFFTFHCQEVGHCMFENLICNNVDAQAYFSGSLLLHIVRVTKLPT